MCESRSTFLLCSQIGEDVLEQSEDRIGFDLSQEHMLGAFENRSEQFIGYFLEECV
jgi:hypothetical protein